MSPLLYLDITCKGAMLMITLKSHAIPASPFNGERVTYYRGKPETTVIGETNGLRDSAPNELVHLRTEHSKGWCAMCATPTGPLAPWMDSVDKWASHPMRCR